MLGGGPLYIKKNYADEPVRMSTFLAELHKKWVCHELSKNVIINYIRLDEQYYFKCSCILYVINSEGLIGGECSAASSQVLFA